jgi:hypothetical protein
VYNPEPGNNSAAFRKSIDEVANKVGIKSIETPSGDSSDIDRLIRSLKNEPNGGLIFLPDAITAFRRVEITTLVTRCKLPATYPLRVFCEADGLMSCVAPIRPNCPFKPQPNLSWWLTKKRPGNWACSCHPRCCCAPTRSSNKPRDFRFWHRTDMVGLAGDARFQGQTGSRISGCQGAVHT